MSETACPGVLRVGLTGNIGSGKSSVARLLEARGALVIDADVLARQATADPEVVERIAAELGPQLVVSGAGGAPTLDRAKTAGLVFSDEAALSKLNAIVHPWVRRRREELEVAALRAELPPAVIVHDVPLLYETGMENEFDLVVVVDAPLEERIRRVRARSGLSAEEVIRRDAAQLPLADKVARADLVVDNAGGPAALEREVARLWELLSSHRRATRGA